jgi:D-xylose transport system permease protein
MKFGIKNGEDKSLTRNAGTAQSEFKGILQRLNSDHNFLPVVLALILIATFFQLQNPGFLSARNISNLLLQVSVMGIVSAGIVLILLTGEIDLSVGSVAGVTAATFGILLEKNHLPLILCIFLMILMGAAIGAIHGVMSNWIGAPTFVVTLAGLLGWQGLQLFLLQSQTINVFNVRVGQIATTYLSNFWGWIFGILIVVCFALPNLIDTTQRKRRKLEGGPIYVVFVKIIALSLVVGGVVFRLNQSDGIPILGVLFLMTVATLGFVLKRTRYGRYIYAVGNSREAARRAGVRVPIILGSVFVISGSLAAFGGLLEVSREAAATTLLGGGSFLLEAIAAAVVGGTSLFGGRGTVWSAVLGALIVGSLANGLDLIGSSSAVKLIIEGLILAVAISADAILRRKQAPGR